MEALEEWLERKRQEHQIEEQGKNNAIRDQIAGNKAKTTGRT